ncbi:CPBP family intramembrane metalloprotease [Candidatus Saccharibacteria bacterium]|nr:CPBP family intramembrane metalloprotease [Candidatus Saccharibacteria bacterium]
MVVVSIILMMIWTGASVIVSQLAVGYAMLWIIGAETFGNPLPTAIYSALSYILAMILVLVVPKMVADKYQKKPKKKTTTVKAYLEELGIKGWPTWADIGMAPLGMIAYLLLATLFVAIFSLFPWFDASEIQDVGFSTYISGFDRVIAFFVIVVLAPIAEEVIFRGWLYTKIKNTVLRKCPKMASIIITNLLVSLTFAIVHLQWNVGVNVFAMSIVLCGLREITGTLYSGIILHMLKNGVAFYLVYVLGIQ